MPVAYADPIPSQTDSSVECAPEDFSKEKCGDVASQAPVTGSSNDYLKSLDPAVLANREAMSAYVTWLATLPGIYDAGFVAAIGSETGNTVTLLWAGVAELQDVVRREAAGRGIVVAVKSVRFSQSQLRDAMERLLPDDGRHQLGDFRISLILSSDLDRDGLAIQGYYETPSSLDTEARRTATTALVKAIAPEVVQIDILPQEKYVPYVTRATDVPSYNAGGGMRGSGGVFCSSGFALRVDGISRATTANHCNRTPWSAWNRPDSSYGSTVLTAGGARVLSSPSWYRMFDGSYNDPTGFSKEVIGIDAPFINDFVCTSEANTGVHCNIQIIGQGRYQDNLGAVFWSYVGRQNNQNAIAGGPGDSGGPVFRPYPNFNFSSVGATGMIQAGTSDRPCPPTWTGSSVCGSEVIFSSMIDIIDEIEGQGRTATLRASMAKYRNVNSGQCLVGRGFEVAVQQYYCSNFADQFWKVRPLTSPWFMLEDFNARQCLVVRGAAHSAVAVSTTCSTQYADQHWRYWPSAAEPFNLQNKNSGLCIVIRGNTPGASANQFPCGGFADQQWRQYSVSQ